MPLPALYYIRHGLTDWNAAGRLQGGRDVPINAQGRAQALRCAGVLRDLFLRDSRNASDLGYASSPLMRARETMDILRRGLGLDDDDGYETDTRLAEIAFGEWEGLTYQEILTRDPEIVATREHNKWEFRPPGGETYVEVAARVTAWHATLKRDTVVTAHGGTGRALVAALGIAPPDEAVHQPIDQGVVYLFAHGRVARYE